MFKWFYKKYDELPRPIEEGDDILRAAIGTYTDNLHVIVRALGDDAEGHCNQWGLVLADIAQHAADLCETKNGRPRDEALEKIREVFNNELEDPTTLIKGHTIC